MASVTPLSTLLSALTVGAFGASPVQGQHRVVELVEIEDLSPHKLEVQGFQLTNPESLRVRVVGAAEPRDAREGWDEDDSHSPYWRGNAWILDSKTRNVVWELRNAPVRSKGEDIREFDGLVRLPAGTYEAYFASYTVPGATNRSALTNVVRFAAPRLKKMMDDRGLSEDFVFSIKGKGERLDAAELRQARSAFDRGAVISFIGVKGATTVSRGFTLDRPTEVEIYAIGEVRGKSAFDYGWLSNADAPEQEKLWQLDHGSSQPAGGAAKNRVSRWRRTLPAGRYAVGFISDDSHDHRDWNGAPPHDPDYWGITVRVADPASGARVRTFEYEDLPFRNPAVSLAGLGDRISRSQGFTLGRAVDIRVYALGEGRDGEMFDYGWIVDARTHRPVWKMEQRKTRHAGGDEKNRLFDGTLRLEQGSYLLYYVTDGSHSYPQWNSSAPMYGKLWGISLIPVKPADRDAFKPYVETRDRSIVAELMRMGDNARGQRRFTLERDADLRIYALGEGNEGEMYDHAWMEEAETGRAVWEMTYRSTEHAGGARKNRLFNGVIRLPAGEYVLRYESDGSHSFSNWNADPPDDPLRWGATVSLETRR